jgi:hypothetical protein
METKTDNKADGALAWSADHAPTYCEGISSLYSWSTNYDDLSPFKLFLDLVGYSADHYGEALYAKPLFVDVNLGAVELSKIGEALIEWANRPHDCDEFVQELLLVESEFGL